MTGFRRLLIALGVSTLALILVACPQPTDGDGDGDTRISFTDDFQLIPFDVDGDGDTTYTFDGEDVDDIVSPAGGRILTYDPDGDGTADLVDGNILRLVSGRFAFDDSDTDYAGYVDEVNFNGDDVWYLNGTVFIGENDEQTDDTRPDSTVLNIAAGADIRGIASPSTPGTLVIDRNGQINATGSATEPIVFTSSKAVGSRASGDWGGLVLNGSGVVQGGFASGEGGTGTFGGSLPTDNSGTLSYVVVQFAGTLFTPDNELNGIVFQAVGSGTTVSHIQVHRNADDGVEFFGGNVAAKYVLLTGTQDDGLDYDDGWNGSAQFVIIHNYGDGGNLIEADGDAATGGVDPADPVLANITMIGGGDAGPNFKSDAEGELWNSVIVDMGAGVTPLTESIDDQPTIAYRGVGIESDFDLTADRDSTVAGVQEYAVDWNDQVVVPGNGNFQGAAGSVVTGLTISQTAPNYVPTALTGATAQTLPTTDLAGNTIDATDFIGAIDANGTDWTDGWTSFPAN